MVGYMLDYFLALNSNFLACVTPYLNLAIFLSVQNLCAMYPLHREPK